MENVSVAMASYNSERYIGGQVATILKELSKEDELVISDDCSIDSTRNIIQQLDDSRINFIINCGGYHGVISNIQNAISNCKNEIIVLSDHDDLWLPGRVEKIKEIFENNADITLVVCDAEIMDENDNLLFDSFYKLRGSRAGPMKNFIKNTYIGCCMAFRKKLVPLILPIPHDVPMHDVWIGILNDIFYKSLFIPEVLVRYRRHDVNVTRLHRSSIPKIIYWRVVLGYELLKRVITILMKNIFNKHEE
jgi:glycosyltransferase involved in cell wall biosynthesis